MQPCDLYIMLKSLDIGVCIILPDVFLLSKNSISDFFSKDTNVSLL